MLKQANSAESKKDKIWQAEVGDDLLDELF
jgi:hypothetical protein